MTAPTLPDMQLDEHTEAELQPPCDVKIAMFTFDMLGRAIRSGGQAPCENPAEWVVRTRCECGHRETSLICDPHLPLVGGNSFVCARCSRYGLIAAKSVEPLNKRASA